MLQLISQKAKKEKKRKVLFPCVVELFYILRDDNIEVVPSSNPCSQLGIADDTEPQEVQPSLCHEEFHFENINLLGKGMVLLVASPCRLYSLS